MIPHRTPFFLPLLYPTLLWRIPTQNKELYLTFDDGPVPGPTEFVLETLRVHSARATFFCIGDNIRKHPEVFKKIFAAGHTIGNHTFNHLNGWKAERQQYLENIERCYTEISRQLNHEAVRLFRPPYGRITYPEINALPNDNIVMWDVLSIDYSKSLLPETCLRRTINACRPGSIIVFHDSIKAEKNMTFALPRLISHFSELGFVFKAIAL